LYLNNIAVPVGKDVAKVLIGFVGDKDYANLQSSFIAYFSFIYKQKELEMF
jgi:hypothetical protein